MSAPAKIVRLLFCLGLVCPLAGQGTQDIKSPSNIPVPIKTAEDLIFPYKAFTFVRIQYSGRPTGRRTVGTWQTDYPDADVNFSARFQKVVGLPTDPEGKVVELTDPKLKEYPFIYMVEAGTLQLSPAEVRSLRGYLLEGGFLMVDDFWGEREWASFQAEIKKVFPDREAVDIPMDHPIFHCFYDIHEKPQVPNVALGVRSQFTGISWERPDAQEPHYRGLMDDSGRLMAIFCHNTDLGDGWERESANQYYYQEFSLKKAYPMGINVVVYALTHQHAR